MTSLTQDLVQLIRQKPVTHDDLKKATLFLLDAVANGTAGKNSVAGNILSRWARAQGDDSGRHAFLFSALAHIQEMDDLHRSSVTHPGCVVVPAALAVGLREMSSGHEILMSILHGYEAMCRIGMAVGNSHYRIWHNTSTCGPYGSAMAAATLNHLTHAQSVHALGNAGTQSSGFWQFNQTGAMSKHLHAGRAAEAGVIATDLAKLDFTGPTHILEGSQGFFMGACPDAMPEVVLKNPLDPWKLTLTSMKPWPSCRHTHAAIDAALALHQKIDGQRMKRVKVSVYQTALDVCNQPNPLTDYQAKFSLHHCVAAALSYGEIDFSSFDEYHRERLAGLRDRVTVTVEEPYSSAYPDHYWGANVTVTMDDGIVLEEVRYACKGDPEAALTDDEIMAKAAMLMNQGGMEQASAKTLINAILKLVDNHVEAETFEKLFLTQ